MISLAKIFVFFSKRRDKKKMFFCLWIQLVRLVDGMWGIGGPKRDVFGLLSFHCNCRNVIETRSAKVELQC